MCCVTKNGDNEMNKLKSLLIIPLLVSCRLNSKQSEPPPSELVSQLEIITNMDSNYNIPLDVTFRQPEPKNNSIDKSSTKVATQIVEKPMLNNYQPTTLVSTTTKIKEPGSVSNTQSDNKPSSQNSEPVKEQRNHQTEEHESDNANKEEPIPPLTEPNPEPQPLCPNALYDEVKPCDYIHPNMLARDELRRDVPSFDTPNKAWDWAEIEMYDEASTWYMCGFSLMEGYYNDETIFYYAYMKACP